MSTGFVRAGGRLSPLMAKLRARRAERSLRGVEHGRLLDIGCGHHPYFLTRSDFARRYGVDREPGPGWKEVDGVMLSVADVERTPRLPFRASAFDAVTMLAVVEHLDEGTLAPLLADVRRVLADGGRLVITTPPPWSDPVLRGLARMGLSSRTELEEHQAAYTPGRLRALIAGAGFARPRAGLFEAGLNVWATGDRSEAVAAPARRVSFGRLAMALLVLAGIVLLVLRERSTFARAIDLVSESWSSLWLGAFGTLIAGRGVLAGASFVIASQRLAGADRAAAAFAWLRSAVAKYVPGIVWYPLTAVERLRRFGVPAAPAAMAFYVDAVGSIVAAVIIGAIALPAFIATEAGTALWLLLAIPGALSLHPRIFALGLRVLGRVTSRRTEDIALSWRTVATVVLLHGGSWLAAGVALELVVRALDAPVSWPLILAATSLSWAAGLLFVPVPAGLGVREAALVAMLVTELPTTTAVAAALASRALFVALDVAAFAASFPASRVATNRYKT